MRLPPYLAVVFLLGCGSGGTKFLEEAKGSAPAFLPAETSRQGLEVAHQRAGLLGSAALNAMYQLLRDYEFPRDEGRVDLTNVYKELHTIDEVGERARGGCSGIAEQPVLAPFEVGAAPSYTCLGNDDAGGGYRYGYALKDQGTRTDALLAFRWSPDPTQQRSLGQIQGHFDTSTRDVVFTLVNLVEYPAGSEMGGATGNGFAVRTDLSGNAGSHTFTLRALVTGTDRRSWTSLIGSGVSRGEGEHFLFKAWVADSAPAAARFFCLPSSIDEVGLGALDPLGELAVPEACAHLAEAVDALLPLTPDDAPLKAADFRDSDVAVSLSGG